MLKTLTTEPSIPVRVGVICTASLHGILGTTIHFYRDPNCLCGRQYVPISIVGSLSTLAAHASNANVRLVCLPMEGFDRVQLDHWPLGFGE
jgi:hypothetical protein